MVTWGTVEGMTDLNLVDIYPLVLLLHLFIRHAHRVDRGHLFKMSALFASMFNLWVCMWPTDDSLVRDSLARGTLNHVQYSLGSRSSLPLAPC
jgi:hypothetical protein